MKRNVSDSVKVVICVILTGSGVAMGQEFTFQHDVDGYAGGQAVTIRDGTPPGPARLRVKAFSSGVEAYNSLIRFGDVETELAGERILEASLGLTWQWEDVAWFPATIDVYPCLRSWEDPNWFMADPNTFWQDTGAQGSNDRGTLISSNYMGWRHFSDTQYVDGQMYYLDLSAELVELWAEDPNSNHGVIVAMNAAAKTDVTFSSNGDVDPNAHPLLFVVTCGLLDFNGDSNVDVADLISLSEQWLGCDGGTADIFDAGDGCVDLLDYGLFAEDWEECTI